MPNPKSCITAAATTEKDTSTPLITHSNHHYQQSIKITITSATPNQCHRFLEPVLTQTHCCRSLSPVFSGITSHHHPIFNSTAAISELSSQSRRHRRRIHTQADPLFGHRHHHHPVSLPSSLTSSPPHTPHPARIRIPLPRLCAAIAQAGTTVTLSRCLGIQFQFHLQSASI